MSNSKDPPVMGSAADLTTLSISKLKELLAASEGEYISTGVPHIDEMLKDGIPRGKLHVLHGAPYEPGRSILSFLPELIRHRASLYFTECTTHAPKSTRAVNFDYNAVEMTMLRNYRMECEKDEGFGDIPFDHIGMAEMFGWASLYGDKAWPLNRLCGPRLSPEEILRARFWDMTDRFLELSGELLEYQYRTRGLKAPVTHLASVIEV